MLHLKMEKLLTKKFLAILVLGLLWNNNVIAQIDLFAHHKSLDYNFICVAPDKALKNDWSDILTKFGFVRVDNQWKTGPKKTLLYAYWSPKHNNYDLPISEVKARVSNSDEVGIEYEWHFFYNNVKSKSGEKVPMIHTVFLSKLRNKNEYFLEDIWIKIPKEEYEMFKYSHDELLTVKDQKIFIKYLQLNTSYLAEAYIKYYNEGNLDSEFNTVCKLKK